MIIKNRPTGGHVLKKVWSTSDLTITLELAENRQMTGNSGYRNLDGDKGERKILAVADAKTQKLFQMIYKSQF